MVIFSEIKEIKGEKIRMIKKVVVVDEMGKGEAGEFFEIRIVSVKEKETGKNVVMDMKGEGTETEEITDEIEMVGIQVMKQNVQLYWQNLQQIKKKN
jgi:hypothetical protein